MDKEQTVKVISTGIKGIDDFCKQGEDLYGLSPGNLGIIGSAMGVGKTTLLTVMGKNMADQGFKVLNIITEDMTSSVVNKYYAADTGISLNEIRSRLPEVMERLSEIERDGDIIIKRMDVGGDLSEVVKPVFEKYDIDVIIFDGHLGVEESKVMCVSTRELRDIAKNNNVVVWGVDQTMIRTRVGSGPMRIYDSKVMVEADVVVHMERYYEDWSSDKRTFKILKHRLSKRPESSDIFHLNFDCNKVKITDYDL